MSLRITQGLGPGCVVFFCCRLLNSTWNVRRAPLLSLGCIHGTPPCPVCRLHNSGKNAGCDYLPPQEGERREKRHLPFYFLCSSLALGVAANPRGRYCTVTMLPIFLTTRTSTSTWICSFHLLTCLRGGSNSLWSVLHCRHAPRGLDNTHEHIQVIIVH